MSEDASDDPLFDRAVLRELIEVLGATQVRPVLTKFFADTATRLTAVESAAAARHPRAVADHLHTLKSTSATLGLVRLSRLARELEAEAERMIGSGARLAELRAAFDASVAGLAAAFPDLA
jgi:HPt (histidine-containing phosphotransfer) domain-containing protein